MKEIVFRRFGNAFLSLMLWSVLTVAVSRVFETLFVTYYGGSFSIHLLNNLLGGCFDIIYLILVSLVLFVPFCLFSKKSDKNTLLIFRILYSIVALVSMLLIGYFSQAGVPLDRVFFMYSLKEIMEIISSSQTTAWWMYLCIAFPPVSLFIISSKEIKISNLHIIISACVIAVCGVMRLAFYDSTVNNKGYYEQSNKICYFLKSFTQGGQMSFDDQIPVKDIDLFRLYFPENEFVSYEYPFLSKENNEDVIGCFFDLGDKKPNIVMIVVEGLGRENSGKHSKFISNTRFLDSLADHSLYWLNCMSVSQRTAGVLPALFGALPFGREGFMAYKRNAPSFNSLPKILEDNGYNFSFYYGGKSEFDNMNDFIEINGGTQGFAEKHSESNERNEWGLYDKYLFSEAIKSIDFESDKPRFDLYMTLTSHMPWDYPDKEKYMDEYRQMMSTEGKEHYYDVQSTASYLYVDEAIRQLITDYSHEKGFENTIFIITGDHNYYLYNYVLERYHVPLLIWSPMLNESRYFPSMATHRDVVPTLISLLKGKYAIDTPNNVAWLNSSLDTSSFFRCRTFAPQMDASRNIVNMIYHDFYVDNGTVYKIKYNDNTLELEAVNDDEKVLPLFNMYKAIDKYVCDNDLLIETKESVQSKWRELGIVNAIPKDTISTNAPFPLELINVELKEEYQAVKVMFDMKFQFEEKNAKEGISMGLIIEMWQGDNKIYNAYNEIRSFNEIIKKYEYNEVLKQSNYNYTDGCRLKIYLHNWSNLNMKIFNVHNSVWVSYPTVSTCFENKIWAHRVNNPDEANKKMKDFAGVEIDLVYDKLSGNLYVGHDVDEDQMKTTFRHYMQKINKPSKSFYWLDMKNLFDNPKAICDTIKDIADYYGFTDRFFVESWDAGALKIAKEQGLKTSLWVANIYEDQKLDALSWKDKVEKAVAVCHPDALSAEYRMRTLLDKYFPTIGINLWQTPAEFNDENVEITREICRDSHVKVVLVDYDKPIFY